MSTGQLHSNSGGVKVNVKPGEYKSYDYFVNKQHNMGINFSVGFDLRILRNKYVFLDVNFNKGFRKINYLKIYTTTSSGIIITM